MTVLLNRSETLNLVKGSFKYTVFYIVTDLFWFNDEPGISSLLEVFRRLLIPRFLVAVQMDNDTFVRRSSNVLVSLGPPYINFRSFGGIVLVSLRIIISEG